MLHLKDCTQSDTAARLPFLRPGDSSGFGKKTHIIIIHNGRLRWVEGRRQRAGIFNCSSRSVGFIGGRFVAVAVSAAGIAGRGVPWQPLRVVGVISTGRFRVSQYYQWRKDIANMLCLVTTLQACVEHGFDSSARFQ